MNDLSIDKFGDYFHALHGRPPYSWQLRLATRAVEGNWPDAIDLPTGSGKTACIDIAIFALACQAKWPSDKRTAPRRIFFCVNRRVIVDEAHQRACKIAEQLRKAELGEAAADSVLRDVAAALRLLAGTAEKEDTPPLDVLELRGGIYRDNRWARSATQPIVVCSTIDQFGSRLLFRGYGVSASAAPIQAALIAYDSLVLLDEAHISRPFQESLDQVRRYLDPEKWAERPIGPRPLIFVPMTATRPRRGKPDDSVPADVFQLDDQDRKHESLARRLTAPKLAQLRQVPDVTKAVVEEAKRSAEGGPAAIGIIVNRVATAKSIYKSLCEEHPDASVELVIGSMRPIDRDEQAKVLQPLVGPGRAEVAEKTSFIIATQCLEVGADYDFDILILECASLDSLRQRFGRLNRGGRPIDGRAIILVKDKDVKDEDALDEGKPLDPIYGNALARTWNWLWHHAKVIPPESMPLNEEAGTRQKMKQVKGAADSPALVARAVNFGIEAFNLLLETDGGCIPDDLCAPSAKLHAPIMLPAYLDFWCQTAPFQVPDPDIALFIHGKQRGEPDVQVCWRDDLVEDEREDWPDVVALLPPTAAECMSVPISRVRRWLAARNETLLNDCDLLGVQAEGEEGESTVREQSGKERPLAHTGVLWRGVKDSKLLTAPGDLRPGDTLVLPVVAEGWKELGHIPETPPIEGFSDGADSAEKKKEEAPCKIDVAEAAFERSHGKAVLRLHPSRLSALPSSPEIKALVERIGDTDESLTLADLRGSMKEAAEALSDDHSLFRSRLELFAEPKRGLFCEFYPDERGMVITTRRRTGQNTSWLLPSIDDGEDDSSRIGRKQPVKLADHTEHVDHALSLALDHLPVETLSKAFRLAAKLHDWGKADERFQAMLLRADRTDAWLFAGQSRMLLAKSDGMPQTPSERQAARDRAGLPSGFRHEMLSVQLAERARELPADPAESKLILHLIAAHHGYGRPFAPVALDDDPPNVDVNGVVLIKADRLKCPPHRLDSGIAERFWSLTHRFGWWGLAYLEALLRLADQQASANEDAGEYNDEHNHESDEDIE